MIPKNALLELSSPPKEDFLGNKVVLKEGNIRSDKSHFG